MELFKEIIAFLLTLIVLVGLYDGGCFLMSMDRRSKTRLETLNNISVEYILEPADFEKLSGLNEVDEESSVQEVPFTVRSNGKPLVVLPQNMLELGIKNDALNLFSTAVPGLMNPTSVAEGANKQIYIVEGERLLRIKSASSRVRSTRLPSVGMKLVSSSDGKKVFAFGGQGKSARRIYSVSSSGSMRYRGKLPGPVTSVAASGNVLFASTRDGLYRVTRRGAKNILRLPTENSDSFIGEIVSMAIPVDIGSAQLFFATTEGVYAFSGWSGMALVKNVGGDIHLAGGHLYLWNQKKRLLVRLPRIEGALNQTLAIGQAQSL